MPDEKAEKAARGKKKKEKTYTLTREQMEAAGWPPGSWSP